MAPGGAPAVTLTCGGPAGGPGGAAFALTGIVTAVGGGIDNTTGGGGM